jgi:ABC-2 type transport system permease protein
MWLVAGAFSGFSVAHPLFALLMVLLAAVAFAAMGFMTAVWADSFERVNFFPTFVITPLTFLGGVFYSAGMVPQPLRAMTLVNPVYYLVESLRWSVMGRSEAAPGLGFLMAAGLAGAAVGLAWALLRSGWRLRG